MREVLNPHNLYLGTNNKVAMDSSRKGKPIAMVSANLPMSGEDVSTSLNFSKSINLLMAAYTHTRINSDENISEVVTANLVRISLIEVMKEELPMLKLQTIYKYILNKGVK